MSVVVGPSLADCLAAFYTWPYIPGSGYRTCKMGGVYLSA